MTTAETTTAAIELTRCRAEVARLASENAKLKARNERLERIADEHRAMSAALAKTIDRVTRGEL